MHIYKKTCNFISFLFASGRISDSRGRANIQRKRDTQLFFMIGTDLFYFSNKKRFYCGMPYGQTCWWTTSSVLFLFSVAVIFNTSHKCHFTSHLQHPITWQQWQQPTNSDSMWIQDKTLLIAWECTSPDRNLATYSPAYIIRCNMGIWGCARSSCATKL